MQIGARDNLFGKKILQVRFFSRSTLIVELTDGDVESADS
jgi:hypothetical protein